MEAFAGYVTGHAGTAQATVEKLDAKSLWLAFASLEGDARALTVFDRILEEAVGLAARHQNLGSEDSKDFAQAVRQQLLVGTATTGPKLAKYSGKGALKSWLRVVVFREARHLRGAAPGALEVDERLLEALPDDTANPEWLAVRHQHKEAFRKAFHAAIGDLSNEERSLLRLVMLEEMTFTELAKAFGVNRTTIGRRIKRVHRFLMDKTRTRLECEFGTQGGVVDSVMNAAQSRMSLSLSRLLMEP